MEKILVVEDVDSLRDQLKWGLGTEYMILQGADRHQAMELFLSHAPKVVTLDLGLPPDPGGTSEGFRCLEWMLEARPGTKVVVVTATEDRENAQRALARGAYDYCQKPINLDHVRSIIRRALHLSNLEEQSQRLQEVVTRSSASLAGIVGQFSAVQELLAPLGTLRDGEGHHAPQSEQKGTGHVRGQAEGQPGTPAGNCTLREARDMVEKGMIGATISTCGGNMAKAAEMLGVSRPALYDLMKKHGLFKGGHHRE